MVPRMLACTLELILEQEQYASFGVAVHLTNTLYDTAADLLPFKSFVKILTGVKILVSYAHGCQLISTVNVLLWVKRVRKIRNLELTLYSDDHFEHFHWYIAEFI